MGKGLWVISVMVLALAVALGGGPAWGAESPAKADKELAAAGQKIDKAAAPADAGRVTERIVDEWKGTKFKFDATSAPRPLTAQDVQDLRAKGLGFGEISILLALTAKQPNPGTAKPLDEVLALRQAGKGWGEVAQELGFKNLGSVLKSVKATEKAVGQVAKGNKPEVSQSGEMEKGSKSERIEKFNKPERPQGVQKLEIDRPQGIERPERPEKPGKK